MLKKLIILLTVFAIENSINCAEAQNAFGINYITKITPEDLAQISSDDVCAICLQALFNDSSNLYKANCSEMLTHPHIFHRNCILGSINSGLPSALDCPLCRGQMANPNSQNDIALIEASAHGNLETVRLLLDRGAGINARNDFGLTALISASINRHLETVRLLLDRGADINARDNFRRTALTFASTYGHLEIVRLLLDRGADINSRNDFGHTALIRSNNHIEIVRLLLDRGADINARDNSGDTALINASITNNLEIVRLLLDRGADINARNSSRDTALTLAREYGYPAIADLLIARGAIE